MADRDLKVMASSTFRDLKAKWCRHFLDRTRTEGGRIFGDGGAEALTDLTLEIANIDAALRAAPGLSLPEPAVAALEGVQRLLSASGAGSPSALDALARACADAADTGGEARCHYWRGVVAEDRSDHDTARARHEEALPLFRHVGDELGEANCIYSLGDIALARPEHDTARALRGSPAALSPCRRRARRGQLHSKPR